MDMLKISSDRLDSTLKNLSDILTLTTDEIEKVQIVLYPEIQKTLDIVRSEVLGETFEFRIDIPHRLQIMAVPSYLDSILLNLISNSIKYRNPDITCEIEIQAWSEGGLTHVSIRDNGLGIPLERVGKHVFGLYKTFHRNANARGLGLFMTKIQIDSMGGRISVESKPMKGSTFTFSLPS
jgi:signal transduction histidine kinase